MSLVQAVLILIADRHLDFAKEVAAELCKNGLRVNIDELSESMKAKIRDAQNQKMHCMLAIVDNNVENLQIVLRLLTGENSGLMPLTEFIAQSKDKIIRDVYLYQLGGINSRKLIVDYL